MPVLNRVTVRDADGGVLDVSEIDHASEHENRDPSRVCVSVQLTGTSVSLKPAELIELAEELRQLHYKITRTPLPSVMHDGRLR